MNPGDPDREMAGLPCPVMAMAKEFPAGHIIPFHSHVRSQFLYACSGVMTVTAGQGIWVVPPLRAVWVPAGIRHGIRISGHLSMRTLYIEPAGFPKAPGQCCVVSVSPLLKELILHVMNLPRRYPPRGPEQRVMQVLLDQIRQMPVAPLNLPVPKDSRLTEIFARLSENPGDKRSLDDWGHQVGATRRTLTRLFKSETGMGFVKWRQQIRILESLRMLAGGEPVTNVAMDLGYDSPSAFIAMFRKTLGKTPGRYFSPLNHSPGEEPGFALKQRGKFDKNQGV